MLVRGLRWTLIGFVLFVSVDIAIANSKIGVAAATKNEVQGIRGSEKRVLSNGSEVFLKESVRTGDESVAHLVFLDNTNLSVGPGSLVELDTFIYDPDRKLAQIVVEVGRGAFRFSTGAGFSSGPSVAKNYSLKTPLATLGIRGTVFELVSTPEEVKVKLNNGLIQVRTNVGQVVWLMRPETLLIVRANGTVEGPVAHDAPITDFAIFTVAPNMAPAGFSRPSGSATDFVFESDRRNFAMPRGPLPDLLTSSAPVIANTSAAPVIARSSTDAAPISPTR